MAGLFAQMRCCVNVERRIWTSCWHRREPRRQNGYNLHSDSLVHQIQTTQLTFVGVKREKCLDKNFFEKLAIACRLTNFCICMICHLVVVVLVQLLVGTLLEMVSSTKFCYVKVTSAESSTLSSSVVST